MPAPIDLSKATNLEDVTFELTSWSVEWIVMALQTITPEHRDFRQITIKVAYYLTLKIGPNSKPDIGEVNCGQWLDLDRLLVQLRESRSIRLKVAPTAKRNMGDCVKHFLQD